MADKYPKDMTASELLRWAANGEPYGDTDGYDWIHADGKLMALQEAETGDFPGDNEVFVAIADKIDAELAQARGEALLQGAQVWAKANGWPDFREGEDFGTWLDRCALPRPRYEDGEPVQFGDEIELHFSGGGMEEGRFQEVNLSNGPIMILSFTGTDHERLYRYDTECDTIKRPAPEALGADGKPIVVGETVWNIFSGIEGIVKALNVNGESTAYVEWSDGRWSPSVLCDRLTHTPPDTQERIDEDAKKHYCTYFGGYSACGTCPASTDGLWGNHCEKQQLFDLLRRQRELDRRTGGE